MLAQITAEQVDIYLRVPPPGDITPIETAPFSINDYIPSMQNIEWSVRCLWYHLLGGLSGMWADHLQY